ncbi:MAG: GNAT family protein [Phycisphaerales bacterium]
MTAAPTVRLLTPADAHAYTNIRREMLADSPWAFSRTPSDDPGCNPEGLAESLSKTSGFAIAAGVDAAGRLVGVAGVSRNDSPKLSHRAILWGVYVSPTYRGRGLSREVVSAAVDAAFSWPMDGSGEPFSIVNLSVSEFATTARALYQSLGFVAWGTQPDALRTGGRSYAETHMQITRAAWVSRA